MMGLADVLFVAQSLCCLYGLYLAINRIRQGHPQHVHTLWYIFFLTFSVVVPFYVIYYLSGELTHDILSHGPSNIRQEILTFLFKTLTDPMGDIYFALGIIYIAMVPQFLSFLFSGLFGCGSRPVFTLAITKFALLGLIKSLCVLSAILIARMLLQLFVAKGFFGGNNLYGYSLGQTLFQASVYLTISFGMLLAYLKLDGVWLFMQKALPSFDRTMIRMTRYNRGATSDSSRSDLEQLLRPVIGHALGDVEVQEIATFVLERRLRGRPKTAN